MSMVELETLIDALRADLSVDEFVERGLTVAGTFEEVDDPVLLGPDGTPLRPAHRRSAAARVSGRRRDPLVTTGLRTTTR